MKRTHTRSNNRWNWPCFCQYGNVVINGDSDKSFFTIWTTSLWWVFSVVTKITTTAVVSFQVVSYKHKNNVVNTSQYCCNTHISDIVVRKPRPREGRAEKSWIFIGKTSEKWSFFEFFEGIRSFLFLSFCRQLRRQNGFLCVVALKLETQVVTLANLNEATCCCEGFGYWSGDRKTGVTMSHNEECKETFYVNMENVHSRLPLRINNLGFVRDKAVVFVS